LLRTHNWHAGSKTDEELVRQRGMTNNRITLPSRSASETPDVWSTLDPRHAIPTQTQSRPESGHGQKSSRGRFHLRLWRNVQSV